MKIFPLVTYPKQILKKHAAKVEKIPSDINEFVENMAATMQKNDGIGLAAPQIDISQQIIVARDVEDEEKVYAFLNPRITSYDKSKKVEEEGCLSLPGLYIPIKRARKVEVVCQTPDGKTVHIKAEGLAARILQHEIDHLKGKLIIDRISPWKRLGIRKQLKEIEKQTHARAH